MKKSREFMDEFMNTWKNMMKYQEVKLNPLEPNYDEFEKAFTEEKKIVETIEGKEIIQKEALTIKEDDWER